MVTINTSYFSKVVKSTDDDNKYVVISNSYPSWFYKDFIHLKNLAPQWSDVEAFKNNLITFEEFTHNYIRTLLSRFESMQAVHDYLLQRVEAKDGDRIILLCWEKNQNLCHRVILANNAFSEEYVGEY